MTTVTPFRAHLLPIHDPTFRSLQPCLLPPPLSVSPRDAMANPFLPPIKLDKSRLEQLGGSSRTSDRLSSWRNAVQEGSPQTRQPLKNVPSNVNANANLENRSTARQPFKIANAIPKPPQSPDVFADSSTIPGRELKRPRELVPAVPVKRPRIREEESARSHKLEEERWVEKWLKAFPNLVLHFEIGADEGPGKQLKAKVVRLGAVRR
jgi:hypothetical protein